jgi:hypothetical protein
MFQNPHPPHIQKKLEKALVLFIIKDLQPLNILKSSSFIKFINLLDSRFVIPQSKAVKTLIHSSYTHSFNLLVEQVSKAKYVSCTTDLWTAKNRQGYLGVTCTWIDNDFNFHEILLTLSHLPSPHTAIAISQKLIDIFKLWKLDKKVISITTDNGKNMVKAFDVSLILQSFY